MFGRPVTGKPAVISRRSDSLVIHPGEVIICRDGASDTDWEDFADAFENSVSLRVDLALAVSNAVLEIFQKRTAQAAETA